LAPTVEPSGRADGELRDGTAKEVDAVVMPEATGWD
jgi:hypothetical protein